MEIIWIKHIVDIKVILEYILIELSKIMRPTLDYLYFLPLAIRACKITCTHQTLVEYHSTEYTLPVTVSRPCL